MARVDRSIVGPDLDSRLESLPESRFGFQKLSCRRRPVAFSCESFLISDSVALFSSAPLRQEIRFLVCETKRKRTCGTAQSLVSRKHKRLGLERACWAAKSRSRESVSVVLAQGGVCVTRGRRSVRLARSSPRRSWRRAHRHASRKSRRRHRPGPHAAPVAP